MTTTTVAATPDALARRRIERATLDNGLRVVVEEDRRLPLVALNLRYDVGSRDEQSGRTGFAHLFEHVMFEGSANVAAGEHFAVLQAAGATLNATTSFDRTTYYETVPSSHFELALWLEADRMGGLELTAATFENQRDVVKNEKRQRYLIRPYGDTLERLHAIAYPPGHPYAHLPIGSMADLDAAALEDARAFHQAWYGPDNCVVTVVGDVDVDAGIELVDRYFGGIPPRRETPAHPPANLATTTIPAPVRDDVTAEVPSPQVTIALRVPADDGGPEHDAVDVLARVLGRGRGSRLFRRLVVERQLAQPDRAMARCEHLRGDATLLIVQVRARSGVDTHLLEQAVEDELADLRRHAVADDELARVRAMGHAALRSAATSVTTRADRYGKAIVEHDDLRPVFDEDRRLDAVDGGAVLRVAERYLAPCNRAVVTHRPQVIT